MARKFVYGAAWSIVVLMGLAMIPINSSAVLSNDETMTTSFSPPNAVCSDNVVGWTPYGFGFNFTNYLDRRIEYTPGNPLTVQIMCTASNNNGNFRNMHVFSLEVYTEGEWINQTAPPQSRVDSWTTTFNVGQTGQRGQLLTVNIANASDTSLRWCIYYTCDVTNIDFRGPPPFFDLDYQNYWILIDNQ